MRIRHYYLIATANLLRRKRTLIFNVLLITIAVTIICLTNTLTMSLGSFIDKFLYNSVEFRTLLLNRYKYDTKFKDKIESAINGDNHIIELYHELFGVKAKLVNPETFVRNMNLKKNDSFGDVGLHAAKQQDRAFLATGRFFEDNESGVGIIPKKFYPDGSFQIEYFKDKVDFVDGNSLIGRTITVNYHSYESGRQSLKEIKTFTYSFKVIGTYDILPNNYYPYDILIPYNDLNSIIKEIDDNNVGFSETYNVTYSIIVDDQKHVEDVINKLGAFGIRATRKSVLGYIGELSKYITIIGYILGYLILAISMINIALTMAGSIKKRIGEIGLMKAIGYYSSQISLIIIMEAFIIGFTSFLITMCIWGLFTFILQYFIVNYASIYMQAIEIKLDVVTLLQVAVLSIFTPILGSVLGGRNSIKITPKAALSRECQIH